MPKYRIADIVFDANLTYSYTQNLCKNYEYFGDEESQLILTITKDDIEREKANGGQNFHEGYLEFLALYRKLLDYALNNANAILFHSSAVMVDGNAYLFTAPSGTGKSTHVKLWCELLGDRAVVINDDKPMIRFDGGEFYVYGTPWNGKHRIDTNTKAKVKAICRINQGKENFIKKISKGEMLLTILNQTIRPKQESEMDKLLSLIEKLLSKVDIYALSCNVSLEAAELSFKVMSGENNED